MSREAVVSEAKKWLGARWQHGVCLPYIATDCGQILMSIYANIGLIEKTAIDYYPRDWSLHRSEERYLAVVTRYAHEVTEPNLGDIAVWKVGRTFSHGAIVVNWPQIIHADIKEGVVLANVQYGRLAQREVRFFSVFED